MPQHCYEQFDPLFSRLLDSFHNSNGDCTSEQAPQPVGFPCTSIVGSNDISLASVIPKMAFADGVQKGDSHVNNATARNPNLLIEAAGRAERFTNQMHA
jgi:hypothetical protein